MADEQPFYNLRLMEGGGGGKKRNRRGKKKRRRARRMVAASTADKKAQAARSRKYGISVKKSGNVTKPAAYKSVAEGSFADPVNFRYPLSPKSRAVNAITRFNNSANRTKGGYSSAEWAKLGKRIAAANSGKVYRNGKVVDARKAEARVKMADGEESLDDFNQRVRDAFRDKFRRGKDDWDTYVKDVYPNHVVASIDDGIYAISFEEGEEGDLSFDNDRTQWIKVEKRYLPISEALRLMLAKKPDEAPEDRGKEWEITVIGPESAEDVIVEDKLTYVRSRNGRLYSAEALKKSVPLFEGVKVYDNHLTDEEFKQKQGMRSVASEWVGVIVKPFWDKAANAVKGTLKIVDATLRKKLVEAHDAGVLDTIGLSIDALGDGATRAIQALGGEQMQVVEKITKALSVDVVADPAAGGRLARLIAAQNITKEVLDMDPKELLELLKEQLTEALKPVTERIAAIESALEEDAEEINATEAAVALAEEHKIDLQEIEGTGEDGQITEADVQRVIDAEPGDKPGEGEEDDADDGDDKGEEVPEAVEKAVAEAKAATAKAEKAAEKAEKREKIMAQRQADSDLAEALSTSGLPQPTRELIAEQFKGTLFEGEKLNESIEGHRKALAALSETGQVRIPEGHSISVSPLTPWDQFEMSLLRLLTGNTRFGEVMAKAFENKGKSKDEIDPYAPQRFSEAIGRYVDAGAPAIPKPVRLSEWFYDLMGGVDAAVDGVMQNERLLEAAVTTGSVTSIVKNALNLMVAADYSVRHRWWEPIVRQEDVDTLDDSTLVRVYGIVGLNVMSEGDAYLETFLRDKINILRSIPNRLANAWYNEISGLVANVFTVNTATGPDLADTGALFNATAVTTAGGHANLLTTALSYSEYITVRTAMRKQTDQVLGAGKRLAIAPRYLLVPVDLESTAEQIRSSELVPTQTGGGELTTPGTEFQTRNILQGAFETIVVPEWTDTDDWAAVADPAMFPAIYLIWLRGRRTPELFSAQDERSGAMFTNDELRYKVRMFGARFSATFDCAPVGDFRPLHKSNV
jgi:uncharacterized protein YutE (UPF0331/DUF86 family)